jgi:hypothetical protein
MTTRILLIYRCNRILSTRNIKSTRNQIFQCKEQFITSNDVPNIEIPLRTVSIQNSLTGEQGFIFCSCKTKCTTKRCKC